MLLNEEFALSCLRYYEEQGIVVDATNGQFAHCPYPEGMGETGYYLLWEHHQQQGLIQSRDVGKMCFFSGDVKKWLTECDPMPDNYFELWDIYEEFQTKNAKEHLAPWGQKAVQDKTGIHNPSNRDLVLKASTYARDNEVGIFDPVNKEKVIQGSIKSGRQAVVNKTGIFSPEYEEKHAEVGRASGSQRWTSTMDGYTSNAPRVASHNRRNGWDPNARIRIS
jgi:hypothetical protein